MYACRYWEAEKLVILLPIANILFCDSMRSARSTHCRVLLRNTYTCKTGTLSKASCRDCLSSRRLHATKIDVHASRHRLIAGQFKRAVASDSVMKMSCADAARGLANTVRLNRL